VGVWGAWACVFANVKVNMWIHRGERGGEWWGKFIGTTLRVYVVTYNAGMTDTIMHTHVLLRYFFSFSFVDCWVAGWRGMLAFSQREETAFRGHSIILCSSPHLNAPVEIKFGDFSRLPNCQIKNLTKFSRYTVFFCLKLQLKPILDGIHWQMYIK